MHDLSFGLKEQYQHLYEYLSTVAWMHYEEGKKRDRDHKGYAYFFGRNLHRVLHPLYFFHQKDDPDFIHEKEKFDPNNPEESFTRWSEKKAFLTTKFREKKLEIYNQDFTKQVVQNYHHETIQWLVQNHHHKIFEFDPHLSFYLDILHWTEEHFLEFIHDSVELLDNLGNSSKRISQSSALS